MNLKFLLAIALLVSTISCSDKPDNKPQKKSTPPAPETTTEAPTEAQPAPTPVPTEDGEPIAETSPPPKVDEKYVDPYVSILIKELKTQLAAKNTSEELTTRDVAFANRIFRVNYFPSISSPRLTLVTHSEDAYNFELVSKKGNVQYFNAFSPQSLFPLAKSTRTLEYTAEVKIVSSHKNNILSIIKIKDVRKAPESGAVVHVFYMQKTGTIRANFVPGYDYANDLTKTSRIFLERLLDNNLVKGEFYDVITEEENISNAKRFNLTISNNFILLSQPLASHYSEDSQVIPFLVDYKSFWRNFCGTLCSGGASYSVLSDPSYVIESQRGPIELKALNIQANLSGREKIKGQKNILPIQFFVLFK